MKKHFLFLFFLAVIQVFPAFCQEAKYIFYLIGDGMGFNQVNLTEINQAAIQNKNSTVPLVFTQFPHTGFASTHSLSNGVTDSGAGGTALAVGKKTKNGVIGMDSSGTTSYKSIAYAAKERGLKVGIVTSVSIDHATPASFYAHQPDRDMYYEIGQEIIRSNFDFFAGSNFLKPEMTFDGKQAPSLFPQLKNAGYQILKGKDAYLKHKEKSDKIILMNTDGSPKEALKYAIDQQPGDLRLADITAAAIQSLQHHNDKGFFLMVEGGKIDWACHANDAATTVQEVLDFNAAAALAYEFYQKHPTETLIVVTADHETGGLGIGNGSSTLKTKLLSEQSVSHSALSAQIGDLRNSKVNVTWEQLKQLLATHTGLYTGIKVNENDDKLLREAYQKSFVNHQNETAKSLYANDDKIAALSIGILNRMASIAWASNNHSAAYAPVYAIGVGAELFNHKMDNTDIPKKIAKAAQLSLD
ncbi:alkaline phosphatase [Sphingobacterium thalpophilum]|uniref:alkaline phosphatase n=1 Tax=Sphingobacterium thalpophilum TaxID=259 RepID=UPI0024A68EED|nr:alkaline phosphatase [Sphingobacterium thalpophilum]